MISFKKDHKSLYSEEETPFVSLSSMDVPNENYGTIVLPATINDQNEERERKQTFKILILEQLLKGLSIIYLAFGVVIAVSFFARQVIVNTDISNLVWNWIGSINSFIIGVIIVLVVISKYQIQKNAALLHSAKHEESSLYFVTIAPVGACACIYLIFEMLRDSIYLKYNCTVIADILQPIFKIIFILVAIMFIKDLTNKNIPEEIGKYVYLLHKYTATLTLVTCVNFVLFSFVNDESRKFQKYESEKSSNKKLIYCNNPSNDSSNKFFEIEKTMFQYFHVFSTIFCLGGVMLLIKPLAKYSRPNEATYDEAHNNEAYNECHNSDEKSPFHPQQDSLFFSLSLIIGLMSGSGIILDILIHYVEEIKFVAKIITYSIVILPHLAAFLCNMHLLKLIHTNYHLKVRLERSQTVIFILWLSFFGIMISFFRETIYSFYVVYSDATLKYKKLKVINLVLEVVNLCESFTQTIMMDYLFRINHNCRQNKTDFSQIYYCALPVIGLNIGLTASNYYFNADHHLFQNTANDFQFIVWDILGCLSGPLTILYRAISAVFLIKFVGDMKYKKEVPNIQ